MPLTEKQVIESIHENTFDQQQSCQKRKMSQVIPKGKQIVLLVWYPPSRLL